MRVALIVLATVLSWPMAQAELQDWQYTVKKQDSLWSICKRYVTDPMCWKKLAVHNRIDNPKYIPPGSIVKIPKSWLIISESHALVIAVEGRVLVGRDGADPDRVVEVGDKLQPNDSVVTYQGSAMIEFADSSRLLLQANSHVRMDMLRYDDRSGMAQSRIELIRGRINNLIEKQLDGDASYQVVTPAAVAAVRGTEFRISRQTNDAGAVVMITELLQGALQMTAGQQSLMLAAGQGLVATQGQPFPAPVDLLPRPTMDLNASRTVQLPLLFEWHPIPAAQGYRVSLFQQQNLIWDKRVESAQIELSELPVENAMLLIRAIDQYGIEGRDRRIRLSSPDS